MEEQQRDLRQLVMKRAADRSVAGSGMASPAPRGEPLIQQVIVSCLERCHQATFLVVCSYQLWRIFLIAKNWWFNSSTSYFQPACLMMFSLFGICTKTLHRPPIGQVERGMCVRRNNSQPAPRLLSPPPSPCACIPPLSPIYHLPLCEASLCNPGRPHPPSWALSVTYRLHRPHLPPCWQYALSPIPGMVCLVHCLE